MNLAYELAPDFFLNLDVSLSGTITKLGQGGGKFDLTKPVCDLLNQHLAFFRTRKIFVAYEKKECVSVLQTEKHVCLQNWQTRQTLMVSRKHFHSALMRIAEFYSQLSKEAVETELDLIASLFEPDEAASTTEEDDEVEALCRKRLKRDASGQPKSAATRQQQHIQQQLQQQVTTAAAATPTSTTTTSTPLLESLLKRRPGHE